MTDSFSIKVNETETDTSIDSSVFEDPMPVVQGVIRSVKKSGRKPKLSFRPIVVSPMEGVEDGGMAQERLEAVWREKMSYIDFFNELEEGAVTRLVNERIDLSYEVFLEWMDETNPYEAYYKHERYLDLMFNLKKLIKKLRAS